MKQPETIHASTIAFLAPNLVLQVNDPFTTGVVYMPVSLATFVASARSAGFSCTVVDAFGENPNRFWVNGNFLYRGLTPGETVDRIPTSTAAIVVYASNVTYHRSILGLIQRSKARFPAAPVIALENSQAVTAYSLRRVRSDFYCAGADYLITGEPEQRGIELLKLLVSGPAAESELRRIGGIGYRTPEGSDHYTEPKDTILELDSLPFPAWDLFPVRNYWRLGYGHGPVSSSRYLPLLSSRGCPYECRFCIAPETNGLRWRARSAKNVVDEMAYFQDSLGVHEFHIEDLNPTVKDKRIREICHEILDRKLKITWKLVAGTKVETIKDEETVALMAQAGCRYVSISPESGSPAVMSSIGKPFNLDHAKRIVKALQSEGIYSQACFVLGFPGEQDADRQLTRAMVKDLAKNGVDEIAHFIVTPVPGSSIYDQFSGYSDYSELHFSPTWRQDYRQLSACRKRLYRDFLLWKLRYHPLKLLVQPLRFLRRKFETKMEMVPYRALHTMLMMKSSLWNRTNLLRWLSHNATGRR